MTAKYWQKGEVLDYKASAAVKNGEVVSWEPGSAWPVKILPPAKPATSMWWVSLRWKRPPVP